MESKYIRQEHSRTPKSATKSSVSRARTTINLEKSIQLLDQSVGLATIPASGILRTHANNTAKFDTSSTFSGNDTINQPYAGEATMALYLASETMLKANQTTTTMRGEEDEGDITTTNVHLLLEDDPAIAACGSLYGDFMDATKHCSSEHQVFELLDSYETTCRDQVVLLQKLVTRITQDSSKLQSVNLMIDLLRQESNTWSLISSLYKDRLEQRTHTLMHDTEEGGGGGIMMEENMVIDSLNLRLSDKQIVDNLYKRDTTVRQAQLVVDWLERSIDCLYDRIEHYTDHTGSWEHTLHAMKKPGVLMKMNRPIVSAMDPDAPIREQKPLSDLDHEDDIRLLKAILLCIRAGKLDKAQELCCRSGQSWRAATLEGWRLYHDPNFEHHTSIDDVMGSVEGNMYRDVWKNVCWRLASDDRLSVVERAIYSSLCGNLYGLLPACCSWTDQLWAYLRTLIDQTVEQELRVHSAADRIVQDLPDEYWAKMLSLESIFREIHASSDDIIRGQSKQRYAIIQKYIILGDIEALVEEMHEWCKDEVNTAPQHLCRFMAHLVLFFRSIGVSTKEELCVSILETYVKSLVNDKRAPLVAFYVATLPQNLQVEWYSHFLEGVTEKTDREECLRLARESQLDVPTITKHVVETIRSRDWNEFTANTQDMPHDVNTTQEDLDKINSLDWLVFDPTQRAEAIKQANAIIRSFLAMRKHTAARQVFNKLPKNSIDLIISNTHTQTGSKDLNPEDDNAIKEYLCIKAYLDAQESFNDWFEHYHNAKPAHPDMLTTEGDFTQRVYQEHKVKQFEMELQRWQYSLGVQTKTTIDKIYNVLLFVDGGWMVDRNQDCMIDKSRQHQMCLIRTLCLPTMCMLLFTVLHATKQYKQCVELADVVAAEDHQLYTVFNKDEMQKFLQKIQQSAVANLEDNLDPLGYKII